MKRIMFAIIFTISILALACAGLMFTPKKGSSKLTIGILQTASHPALDMAREGFIQELTTQCDGNVSFIMQNAQLSMPVAHTIARSFHTNPQVDALCGIGTMATQALIQVEKQKPVFFSAVSDASVLGITSTNVWGVEELINVDIAAKTIKALFPHAKTVAILGNPAEVNSVSLTEKMKKALEMIGIVTIKMGINSETEILAVTTIAAQKADILFVPTDNLLAGALGLIAHIGLKSKKPLFICDSLLVKNGVFAAAGGTDYLKNGTLTAQLAVQVLRDYQEPTIEREKTVSSEIVISKKILNELSIELPKDLQQKISLVE